MFVIYNALAQLRAAVFVRNTIATMHQPSRKYPCQTSLGACGDLFLKNLKQTAFPQLPSLFPSLILRTTRMCRVRGAWYLEVNPGVNSRFHCDDMVEKGHKLSNPPHVSKVPPRMGTACKLQICLLLLGS